MAIKDLEARQSKVDIVVEVVEVSEPREFQKFGRTGKVATATVKDESGTMNLSLWNEEVDKVKPGDKVHIQNGYVNEYQGEKQLTAGRFGTLEVVGKEETAQSAETTPTPEKTETEPEAEDPQIDVDEEEVK